MQFNFDNAFMHFARTGAPRGFVWRYVLAYVAACIGLGLVTLLLFGGWYAELLQAYATQDPETIMAASNTSGGMMILIYLVVLPLSLFFHAVFEAAYLRRYMRQDRFFLRIGRDEWNIFVVLLLWMVLFIALTIVLTIMMIVLLIALAVVSSGESFDSSSAKMIVAMTVFVYLAMFLVMSVFGIKFSPAAAMTIRDRRVRFFEAWRVTKGKFWTLLGAYAAWFLLALVGYTISMFIMATMFAGSAASLDTMSDRPLSILGALGPLLILTYLIVLAAGACFYYIWAGPAALAAKTDPRYSVSEYDTDLEQ